MQSIVINTCYGCFCLSKAANVKICHRKGIEPFMNQSWDRDDPDLVAVVREMGDAASDPDYSCLRVVEIPDDVEWDVIDYDGVEHIEEVHREWYYEGK